MLESISVGPKSKRRLELGRWKITNVYNSVMMASIFYRTTLNPMDWEGQWELVEGLD